MKKLNKLHDDDIRKNEGKKLDFLEKENVKNLEKTIKDEKELRDTTFELIRRCQDKSKSVRKPLLIWMKYLNLMSEYTDDWTATSEYGIEPNFEMIDEYNNVMNAYKKTLKDWLRFDRFK